MRRIIGLLLLGLAPLAAGCSLWMDFDDGIACASHAGCPEDSHCGDEGVCEPGERIPEESSCEDDGMCFAVEHCQADHHCHPGARACDDWICAQLHPNAICFLATGRCLKISCVNDFNCGYSGICEANACLEEGRSGTGRPDGQHCSGNDCQGSCLHYENQPANTFCSSTCDPNQPYRGCGEGMYCDIYTGNCVPRGLGNFGTVCDSALDCRDGLCVRFGQSGDYTCSRYCLDETWCPPGHGCAAMSGLPAGIELGACRPEG